MSQVLLNISKLSYQYDHRIALKEVSLELHQGEMMGLVGPNGSGKSTLIKVMLGLLPLQSGTIQWFGTELHKFKEWSKIGYVSQKSNSFNSGFPATVIEVVSMGLTGKLGLFRRIGSQEKEQVKKAIEMVGLSPYLQQNIGELSGGQQQRVFIARALVSDPAVLILDEPTVGVDTQSEAEFYQLLQRLNTEVNLSILLVSHDLGFVKREMHTIACLNQHLHFLGDAKNYDEHLHHQH